MSIAKFENKPTPIFIPSVLVFLYRAQLKLNDNQTAITALKLGFWVSSQGLCVVVSNDW